MERSRRDLSNGTMFVVCAHLQVLEKKSAPKIVHPRGCVILCVVRYALGPSGGEGALL